MLNRRKFLKISGLITLAFSFLPKLFLKNSSSAPTLKNESSNGTLNWLYGSSRKGCSTSRLAMDYHGSLENGLDDFLNFRIFVEFT
jgi:anaerobic selenocysteine-containing dehydrogenase